MDQEKQQAGEREFSIRHGKCGVLQRGVMGSGDR